MKRQAHFPLIVVIVASFGFGCSPREDDPNASPSDSEGAAKPPLPAPPQKQSPPRVVEKPAGDEPEIDDPGEAEKDYVSLPAIGIKIVRPAGFEDAEDFHGFIQADTQSSVMALKIPGPYSEVSGGFNPDEMKARGMILLSRADVEIAGEKGLLLSLTQEAYGIEFSKWLVAFGNEKATTMVTATFPTTEAAALSAELKASVLSTKADDSPPPAPGEGLNFTIETSEKLSGIREIGKMLICTKDDVVPAASPEDPLFVVGPSVSKAPIEDRKQFARQRLIQTANTKVGKITSSKAITIDGLEGYELLAEAEDAESGTLLVVYQVVLFEGDGSYYLMQGLVGAQLRDEYLPEFKAIAGSFLKDSN